MSPSRNGFTLVEVAFAVAILAFVLVTLIGLLAVGLSTQKASVENIRMAAMSGYVMASEQMKPFATVSTAGYTTNYYFDLQGNTNIESASYLQCTVTNAAGAVNSATGLADSSVLGGNVVPEEMVFVYPLPAPAKTNVFYFNRSNE